jgi:hypothetical protein
MPKSPVVVPIEHFSVEDERCFYSDLTGSFYRILGDRFNSLEEFRVEFADFRSDLNEYRATLDRILEDIAPKHGLTWRDFMWLKENRWKQCAVCGRIYLDYTNGKSKTCYLDEYLRFSLQSRRFIDSVDYRGRVKSMCSSKYTAWKKRGRCGPIDFVMFRKGEFR